MAAPTVRSEHADRFNHDEDAASYDEDVRRTADPIRTGYDELLDWVADRAAIEPTHRVLELGSGTGNLTLRIPPPDLLVCIDISKEMTAIAREKVGQAWAQGTSSVDWIQCDLLETFEHCRGPFDAVVSTYTIHHLTADEKRRLLSAAARELTPRGRLVVGDLAFEDAAARRAAVERYRALGQDDVVEAVEGEFFWELDTDLAGLRDSGFAVEVRRVSDLSWGFCAQRRGTDAVRRRSPRVGPSSSVAS